MSEVEKLIERLEGIEKLHGKATFGYAITDAAAMFRSLAAEKAKAREDQEWAASEWHKAQTEIASLRAKLERAIVGLKEIAELADVDADHRSTIVRDTLSDINKEIEE